MQINMSSLCRAVRRTRLRPFGVQPSVADAVGAQREHRRRLTSTVADERHLARGDIAHHQIEAVKGLRTAAPISDYGGSTSKNDSCGASGGERACKSTASTYCRGDWEPVRNSTGRSPRDRASFTPSKLACGLSMRHAFAAGAGQFCQALRAAKRASLKLVTNAKRPDFVIPSHVPPFFFCRSRPANRSLWSSQKCAGCVGLHPHMHAAWRSRHTPQCYVLLRQASTYRYIRRG